MSRSPEQITTLAEKHATTERGVRTIINRLFRAQDESHLYPINNRFNATDKAIRNVQRFERDSGCALYGLEYAYAINNELSTIVNQEF